MNSTSILYRIFRRQVVSIIRIGSISDQHRQREMGKHQCDETAIFNTVDVSQTWQTQIKKDKHPFDIGSCIHVLQQRTISRVSDSITFYTPRFMPYHIPLQPRHSQCLINLILMDFRCIKLKEYHIKLDRRSCELGEGSVPLNAAIWYGWAMCNWAKQRSFGWTRDWFI